MTPNMLPTLIDLPDALGGERIVLRPLCADDAEQVFTAIEESREHLRQWVRWADQISTLDETRDYCLRCAANWLLRSDLTLGIFDIDDGLCLGGMDLHHPNWTLRTFAIGFWLRASAVGRGLMSEAVNLLTAFAFDSLAANRVEISCDVRNDRSRAVAERCGFVLEGRLRNWLPGADGEPADAFVFSRVPGDV